MHRGRGGLARWRSDISVDHTLPSLVCRLGGSLNEICTKPSATALGYAKGAHLAQCAHSASGVCCNSCNFFFFAVNARNKKTV